MTNAEITKALGDARRLLQEVTGVALHAPTAVDLTTIDHVVAQLERAIREGFDPIPMVLWCPACGRQHIDMVHASDPDWTNPPHRSHKCASCSHVWRPADVATTGVFEIETRGAADTSILPGTHQPVLHRVQAVVYSRNLDGNSQALEDLIIERLQASPITAGRVVARLKVLGPWVELASQHRNRSGRDVEEWTRFNLVDGTRVLELYRSSPRMGWSGMYHAADQQACNDVGPYDGFRDLQDGRLALDAFAEKRGWSLARGERG